MFHNFCDLNHNRESSSCFLLLNLSKVKLFDPDGIVLANGSNFSPEKSYFELKVLRTLTITPFLSSKTDPIFPPSSQDFRVLQVMRAGEMSGVAVFTPLSPPPTFYFWTFYSTFSLNNPLLAFKLQKREREREREEGRGLFKERAGRAAKRYCRVTFQSTRQGEPPRTAQERDKKGNEIKDSRMTQVARKSANLGLYVGRKGSFEEM